MCEINETLLNRDKMDNHCTNKLPNNIGGLSNSCETRRCPL